MNRNDAGFSLLEALVALGVLAVTLSGLVLVLGSSAERVARSMTQMRALIQAEALLARVGLDIPATSQRADGMLADGSRWHLSVTPYEEGQALPGLVRVVASVEPPGGRMSAAEVRGLRLAQGVR